MNTSSGLLRVTAPIAALPLLVVHPSAGAGVLLILLAVALFAAELHLGISGLLALLGIAALTAGVLVLVAGAGMHLGLPLWLLSTIVLVVVLLGAARLRSLWRSHRRLPIVGEQSMIGRKAKVMTPLDPSGYVQIGGESWKARLAAGHASPGEFVSVVAVHGLELEVRRIGKGIAGLRSAPFSRREGRDV